MPDTIRPAPSRRALAWALWSCAAFVFVASLAFGFAKGLPTPLSTFSEGGAFIAYGLVGLVIARREPRNPIGWILLGVWVGVAIVFGFGRDLFAVGIARPPQLRPARCSRTGSETGRGSPSSSCSSPTRSCCSRTGSSPAGDGGPWGGPSRSSRSHGRWHSPSSSTTTRTGSTSPPPTRTCPSDSRPCSTPHASWISFFVIAAFGACVAALVVRYRRSRGVERRADPVVDVRRGADGGMVHAAARSRQRWRRGLHPGVRPDVDPDLDRDRDPPVPPVRHRRRDPQDLGRRRRSRCSSARSTSRSWSGSDRSPTHLALPIAATALVAVAFQPVRDRANRLANRLVYGDARDAVRGPRPVRRSRRRDLRERRRLAADRPRDRRGDGGGERRGVAPSRRRAAAHRRVAGRRRAYGARDRRRRAPDRGRPGRGGPPPRRAARCDRRAQAGERTAHATARQSWSTASPIRRAWSWRTLG